jgi:hypothetical protein
MKRHRFLSILTTICLLTSIISGITISPTYAAGTYGQTTTYTIPTVTAAAYGATAASGTDYAVSGNTVTIYTGKGMAFLTQNSTYWGSSYTIKLADNVVCSGFIWSRIGDLTNSFQGTFDGQGHTISGIYLDTSLNTEWRDFYQGLFGYANGGSINNVGVINSYISGNAYVGGIAGRVDSETVTNCWNSGEIISSYGSGGIVGRNYGNVTNCYNTGTIKANTNAGGIVGQNNTSGNVTSCYYLTGSAKDGSGKIQTGIGTEPVNTAATDINGQTNAFSGPSPATLSNAAYTITNSAGTSGQNIAANASLTTALNTWVESTTYYTWKTTGSSTGYPIFDALYVVTYGQTTIYNEPKVTAAAYATDAAIPTDYEINVDTNTVTINTGKGMAWLTQNSTYWGSSYTIKLASDIVCAGFIWSPIGVSSNTFKGTFDGQGHTISGIYLNTVIDYQGLFGYTQNGSICNVGVINSYIKGRIGIAGIVGNSEYTKVTNCWNSGEIISNNYSGGIVGLNYGSITNCYNTGTITADVGAGGIVGRLNWGNVTNCYNTGTISGTAPTVENTNWGKMVGGVVGSPSEGSVASCYYLAGSATDGSGKIQTGIGTEPVNTAAEDNYGQTNAFDGTAPVTLSNTEAYTITNSAITAGQSIAANAPLTTALNTWVKSITYRTWTTIDSSTGYPILDAFYVVLPTIASATYNAGTGVLAVTGADMNSGDTIAVKELTLKGEGGSTYTLTTSDVTASSSTAYSVTLNAADKAAVNQILNKNSTSATDGTTYNLAAADDWDSSIAVGDSSDDTSTITVSEVPVPQITSATYDADTGVLVVTGTGFLKRSGPANDIDVTKLSLKGENNTAYSLTSTTSSVEITSGTSFTVTLCDADKAAVNQKLNKNGTSSADAKTYSLAAAEDWAAGADAAVTIADLAGNGITVSNANTTITSLSRQTPASEVTSATAVTYRATFATGVTGLTASNFDLFPTVTGASITAVSVVSSPSNTQWDITVNTGTGDGTITLRLKNGTDLTPVISTTMPYSGQTYTLDKSAPDAPAVIAPANGSATSDTTPSCSGTAEAASTVTVYIDGTSAGTTTASITGSWSYTPGSALRQASHTVKATATDSTGNISTASAIITFTVDATAPDAPTVSAPANGSSTSVTTPNCSGTAEASSNVTVYIDGISVGTTTASGLGSWSYTLGSALSVASHTVKAMATDSAGNISTDSAISTFTVTLPAAGSTGGSKEAVMLVDGQQQTVGTLKSSTNKDGQNVTTVTLDETKLNQFIDATESSPTVIISVSSSSDVIDIKLNGLMINNLEDKNVILKIQTNLGSYTLPASDIDIESILQQFGGVAALADIQVSIEIAEPSAETVQVVQNAAKEGEFTIVVPAVDFTVKCTYNNQTVNVPSYDTYAQRTVAIPEGVDPTKITTGVIVEPDGTVNHVPTHVTIIDGKYYAVINSLTNSTYTVVWNPVEFADLTKYWAKDTINDLGSRMVVSGVDGKNYEPDRDITRAEFAVIVVKALGLKQAAFASSFKDVKKTDWFCGYDETATSYGLIAGYSNGKFGPNDKLTREQAMTIISRAMTVTKLNSGLTASQITTLISGYKDGKSVSVWAANGIGSCLKTGIVTGKTNATLCPLDNITRAEVAVMVQRLLQKSNLI